MFSVPSFYELGSGCSDTYDIFDGLLSSQADVDEIQELSPNSMAEAKAIAASNSHKEAERRRRKRINAHIATLKSILPNTIKTDKATLLGEAVRRVKELKQTASDLTLYDVKSNNSTLNFTFPTEMDELKISRCEGENKSGLIQVTLCCDDRPEIVRDIIHALKSAEAKVGRAEMSTIGGRTNVVLWVKLSTNDIVDIDSDVGLGTLRRALKMVLDKSTLLAGSAQILPGHKRPRYYHF